MSPSLSDEDYTGLLEFRDSVRRFLHWSEQLALASGVTPAQHQLLLAIRGHPSGPPTIGEVAGHLLLRHHSVVGLVDRAEQAGLVERRAGGHPAVAEPLEAETAYPGAVTTTNEALKQSLFEEIVPHIQEPDLSVPARKGPWWSSPRTVGGLQSPLHCRLPAAVPAEA